jgi:pimeloyl-ACP methyl ester carboxylesterase
VGPGVPGGSGRARTWALALSALAALLLFAPPPARAALSLRPCPKAGEPLECGTLPVPLDPSGAVAGTLRLHVERLPADAVPTRGVVLALAGGPGQSASSVRDGFEPLVPDDRDLLIFDQRGTGRSGALRCPELERSLGLAEGRSDAEICAGRLGAARAFYTTRESVADIEAVRQALGIERLEIVAVSYGTKVALAYAAAHPDRVERLVLDSVVPAVDDDPFLTDSMTAARRVLRSACTGPCKDYSADPGSDLRTLIGRMTDGPLRGYYVDSDGRRRPAAVGRLDLFSLLLIGDFAPAVRGLLVSSLASAVRGDLAPLERLKRALLRVPDIGGIGALRRLFSVGAFAATTCEEAPTPWPRGTPLGERRAPALAAAALRPSELFAPFDRETILAQASLCERWPVASAAPPSTVPAAPAPTLLLEGADDIRTNVEGARRVAAGIPGARVVVAPGGHDVTADSCGARLAARFLAGRGAGECTSLERSIGENPPAEPLAPLRLRDVAPARGVGGRPGRTLTAAVLTVFDSLSQSGGIFGLVFSDDGVVRGGGLRGGSWELRLGERDVRFAFNDDQYVPGVRVSGRGTILPDPRLRLKVRGSSAARGTVVIDAEGAHGALGGRRFAVRPSDVPNARRLKRMARRVLAQRAAARRGPRAPAWLPARALR